MRLPIGRLPLEVAAACALIVSLGCQVKLPPIESDDEITVEMTGADYTWIVRHAGFDGQLNTNDDRVTERNLHAPAGRPVHVLLRSKDLLYAFLAPDLGVNEIAVPELTYDFRFEVESSCEIPFLADQLCGFQHESLLGTIIVLTEADYADWLRRGQHTSGTSAPPTDDSRPTQQGEDPA